MSKWEEDAENMQEADSFVLFENAIVSKFLDSPTMFGIAGIKGQGKTFLLKYKRIALQKKQKKSGIICFPKNGRLLDVVDSTIFKQILMNNQIKTAFNDYTEWVAIWKFSLVATIIGAKEFSNIFPVSELNIFPNEILYYLNRQKNGSDINYNENLFNPECRPSRVLQYVLACDFKLWIEIEKNISNLVNLLCRIQKATYIFIDKVDQSFSDAIYRPTEGFETKYHQDIEEKCWYYSQYALARAAYEINEVKGHIKIYYSIRQECKRISDSIDPGQARNIDASIVSLTYTKNDIMEMLHKYIKNDSKIDLNNEMYKKENPIKALVGFDTMKHPYATDEDTGACLIECPFDYIYRHSTKRPCDMMLLRNRLHRISNGFKNLEEQAFRDEVNRAGEEIVRKYIEELNPFSQINFKSIETLLDCINTNVFDFEYLQYVCERYHLKVGGFEECRRNCKDCNSTHPFSKLFHIGLIGYLDKGFGDQYKQKFMPIGDEGRFNPDKNVISRRDILFFLHPSLNSIARERRYKNGSVYKPITSMILGDGSAINSTVIRNLKNDLSYYKNELCNDSVFISSTINDLKDERLKIAAILRKKGYQVEMSNDTKFRSGSRNNSNDHCIDEALKCGRLIMIVGKTYGGKYIGKKYHKEREEIIEKSNKSITEPSITLMEWYVAKKEGRACSVYIPERLYKDSNQYSKLKEKEQMGTNNEADKNKKARIEFTYGTNIKLFNLINFITHMKNENGEVIENWRPCYKNTEELYKMIESESLD